MNNSFSIGDLVRLDKSQLSEITINVFSSINLYLNKVYEVIRVENNGESIKVNGYPYYIDRHYLILDKNMYIESDGSYTFI